MLKCFRALGGHLDWTRVNKICINFILRHFHKWITIWTQQTLESALSLFISCRFSWRSDQHHNHYHFGAHCSYGKKQMTIQFVHPSLCLIISGGHLKLVIMMSTSCSRPMLCCQPQSALARESSNTLRVFLVNVLTEEIIFRFIIIIIVIIIISTALRWSYSQAVQG